MSAVTALLSLALFVLFAGSAIQKFRFTPLTASNAEHLGLSKTFVQRAGAIELLGGLGLASGLSATAGLWAIVNEVAAGAMLVTALITIVIHRRADDRFKGYLPAIVVGLACAAELVLRLNA
jgi:hypothetical protein